jgi:predicted O-methyltransferase YrrM
MLHLFDSFEGLPEDWVGHWKKGHFDLKGKVPKFDPKRTRVYKGWFSDTVPRFARTLERPVAFIHMDADLYQSTMDVLEPMNEKIAPGTIILFDEYIMKGQDDEHRALWDWADKYGRKFEYLWRTKHLQVAVKVTE